jgi:hypothetical protein
MRERVAQQLAEVSTELQKLPRKVEQPLPQLLGLLDSLAERVRTDLDGSNTSAAARRSFKAIDSEFRNFARSIFAARPRFALGKGRADVELRGDAGSWVQDAGMDAEVAAGGGGGDEDGEGLVVVVSEVQQVIEELKTIELPTFFNYR